MFLKVILSSCILALAYGTKPYLGFISHQRLGSRITGGENAREGEFPHQVSLQWGLPPVLPLSHMCGGTILNENWILTAAHCPLGVPFGNLYVKAGKHNIQMTEATEQTVVVEKSIVHSKYTGGVAPYDISLLKLKSPLRLNARVQKINLPRANSEPKSEVVLSGWGSISTHQVPIMPSILQKAKLSVVDRDTCKRAIDALVGSSPLHETNVCTGPLTGGMSACSGDSGGPLIQYNDDGSNEVIGVVSWGIVPCGSSGAPSVYTKVSSYIDWIESTIAGYSDYARG